MVTWRVSVFDQKDVVFLVRNTRLTRKIKDADLSIEDIDLTGEIWI
jgi:hypothetical protein